MTLSDELSAGFKSEQILCSRGEKGMRLESTESGRAEKKMKKARVNGFKFEYQGKPKSGKVVKPVLRIDSPDCEIPPLKLNPLLANSLRMMLEEYLEAVKDSEWHDGYRVHADWEDPQLRDESVFDDDDW